MTRDNSTSTANSTDHGPSSPLTNLSTKTCPTPEDTALSKRPKSPSSLPSENGPHHTSHPTTVSPRTCTPPSPRPRTRNPTSMLSPKSLNAAILMNTPTNSDSPMPQAAHGTLS